MKQIVLVFPKANSISFENRSIPEPKVGECLIRNMYTMISPGTELALLGGTHVGFTDPEITWARYPIEPGYAAVGEVVDSRSASGPDPGTRVLYYGRHATYGLLETDTMVWTPLPPGAGEGAEVLKYLPLRFAQIALTAILARVRVSRFVLVYGAGIVGNLCAQLFGHVDGVRQVAVVDLLESRLTLARQCGLTTALRPDDVPSWAEKWTRGAGPDTVVEATGAPPVVQATLQRVARRGQVLLLGSTRGTVELNVYKHVHRKLVTLVGSHESLLPARGEEGFTALATDLPDWLKVVSQQQALEHLAAAVSAGRIHTASFIQEVIRPELVGEAYGQLRDQPDQHLGVCIDWQG
jgi:NADPH-dependent curcumin reductase CurA